MVQNVRYLNGPLSHLTLPFETGHQYFLVFRWIRFSGVRYSDGYCKFFIQILFVFNPSDRFLPEFKSPVEWLKSSLSEEGDDRETEEADGDEGVAVLPLTEECIMAMEKEQFLQVMRLLEIAPPGTFIFLDRPVWLHLIYFM